jgi:hypothetical protein
MKCPACKEDDTLYGVVTIEKEVPVVKGGGINLAGINVTQKDIKEQWAESQGTAQGQAKCRDCGASYRYEKGVGFVQVMESAGADTAEEVATPDEDVETAEESTRKAKPSTATTGRVPAGGPAGRKPVAAKAPAAFGGRRPAGKTAAPPAPAPVKKDPKAGMRNAIKHSVANVKAKAAAAVGGRKPAGKTPAPAAKSAGKTPKKK